MGTVKYKGSTKPDTKNSKKTKKDKNTTITSQIYPKNMSSLHREARRRQDVADKRMAHSLKQQVLTDNEYTQVIQEIADEMSKDCAVPEHFLISKSKAALSKCNEAKADAIRRGEVEAEVAMDEGTGEADQKSKDDKRYTARIPNRYSSINYIQQY